MVSVSSGPSNPTAARSSTPLLQRHCRGSSDSIARTESPSWCSSPTARSATSSRILKRTQDQRGETRIFTVGVDTAVNTGLLTRLAAVGHGTSAFVEPDAALDAALASIAREIGAPVVTDLKINGRTTDLAPARLPDLFAGRFVNLFFRSKAAEDITIRGKAANGRPFVVTATATMVDMPAVTHLWARAHVRDLEDRYRTANGKERDAVKKEIIAVSLARTVLTRMTAFIAIDDVAAVADPSLRQKIVQPVHVPAQWAMAMPAAPPRRAEGWWSSSA